MAFNSKNFSVMAYANGFTLWNYQTPDTLETVTASGYFNEASAFARKGDMILTVANNSAAVAPAILVVSDIAAGSVTVAGVIPQANLRKKKPHRKNNRIIGK